MRRILSALLGLAGSLTLAGAVSAADPKPQPAPLPREFRGVWVATVANIDWPSRRNLPVEDQQRELIAILDRVRDLHMNAVVFQVRPMADALYASKLEPWSEFLTGKLGQAPEPFYDPLEFAIREAHARGLELHAWFNPYRAHHPSARGPIPEQHVVKTQPNLAKKYGKHYWLNPTNPEVQDLSIRVMLDVVRRYDVDGIHLDDYFYPYKEKDEEGKVLDFPDDDTWAAYRQNGGTLARDDWRRDAVNRFVQRLYAETKAAKPWVKVGISPFGIWRPGNPPGIQGFDQFGELYADARLWLNQGWVDYWTPQLYWPIKQEKQSYPKLLSWWAKENAQHRHLWPGNYASRVSGRDNGWPPQEIVDQIQATRAQAGAHGNIFFSVKAMMTEGNGLNAALKTVYNTPALIPASPWLDKDKPAAPHACLIRGDQLRLKVMAADEPVRWFVLATQRDGQWKTTILPLTAPQTAEIPLDPQVALVRIAAIDRCGNESPSVELRP